MNKIIFYTIVLLISFFGKAIAQEKTFEERAKEIADKIQAITIEEKNELKKAIDAIDEQVNKAKITKEKGEQLKLKIAEEKAANIETRIAVEEEKLNQLIQDKVDGKVKNTDTIQIGANNINNGIKTKKDIVSSKKIFFRENRTTSQFVFAVGLNNLITKGEDIENSDFRVWGSHFYELGFTYNTRIFKNNNFLHAKYGFSVMYNNLRPTENRYFEKDGNQTNLQMFTERLKDSRFRNVYLAFPAHLEFDFTSRKISKENNKIYFRTHQSIRIGLGGYAGVRVKSKQILKYELDGDNIKDKQKGDYNVSDFIYGLSAYIGFNETSLYVKYDINPLFKNNIIDQNNVSLGVRFDFN